MPSAVAVHRCQYAPPSDGVSPNVTNIAGRLQLTQPEFQIANAVGSVDRDTVHPELELFCLGEVRRCSSASIAFSRSSGVLPPVFTEAAPVVDNSRFKRVIPRHTGSTTACRMSAKVSSCATAKPGAQDKTAAMTTKDATSSNVSPLAETYWLVSRDHRHRAAVLGIACLRSANLDRTFFAVAEITRNRVGGHTFGETGYSRTALARRLPRARLYSRVPCSSAWPSIIA